MPWKYMIGVSQLSYCSFDWSPEEGLLLDEWLTADSNTALVPAGPGLPDRTGFRLWSQTLCFQDLKLVLISPANINSITFWYWRRGLKDWDPFWARPWPSGLALADQILRQAFQIWFQWIHQSSNNELSRLFNSRM